MALGWCWGGVERGRLAKLASGLSVFAANGHNQCGAIAPQFRILLLQATGKNRSAPQNANTEGKTLGNAFTLGGCQLFGLYLAVD